MVPLVVPAAASLVPPIMPTITIFAHSTNDNPHGDDDDDDDDNHHGDDDDDDDDDNSHDDDDDDDTPYDDDDNCDACAPYHAYHYPAYLTTHFMMPLL